MIRAIMAVVMGIVALALIWFLPRQMFDVFVLIVVAASSLEYMKLVGLERYEKIVYSAGILFISAAMIYYDPEVAVLMLSAALFIVTIFTMWMAADLVPVLNKLGRFAFGVLYLGVSLSMWAWLRHLPSGKYWVILTIVPACLCDTFAYIFGKTIGRRKFAPLVSPNKTWEGFFGALVGSVVGTFAVKLIILQEFPAIHAFFIALGLWIFSPLGDLIESLIKRSVQVKDSGTIIPGHGGILDRVDALVFSPVFVYFYLKYIFGA